MTNNKDNDAARTGAGWRKEVVPAPRLPDSTPFGFVQCVKAGPLVFITGQIGVDENYRLVSHEFGPQAARAFENLGSCLAAAPGPAMPTSCP